MVLKVLIVLAGELRTEIERQLTPLSLNTYFADSISELNDLLCEGNVFQVALIPARLSPSITWWELWNTLGSSHIKPALLIYAPSADFQLWAGVLDAGGYDLITDPLSPERLRRAIIEAHENFIDREAQGRGKPWTN